MSRPYRTWGVRLPSGDVRVYGDQEWVRSGRAVTDAHPDGEVVVCDVTITAGTWRAPAPDDEGFPVFTGLRKASD